VSYTTQAALASDTSFRDRVRLALATAAVDVMGEAKGSMSDTVFGKRQSFAYSVISNSNGYVDRFAWAVVANVAINNASSDSDIQFTVNSLWNDMSGVTITD
jgi:hypothetical protein